MIFEEAIDRDLRVGNGSEGAAFEAAPPGETTPWTGAAMAAPAGISVSSVQQNLALCRKTLSILSMSGKSRARQPEEISRAARRRAQVELVQERVFTLRPGLKKL